MIQAIPIGKSAANDVLIWSKEENGCYSVRSGYKFLNGVHEEENPNQNNRETKFWKKLWVAKILSKIKICAWKIAHDFLPYVLICTNGGYVPKQSIQNVVRMKKHLSM